MLKINNVGGAIETCFYFDNIQIKLVKKKQQYLFEIGN